MQSHIEREIGELHRTCSEALQRFASTFALDRDICRDAVQEAFLRYFIERRFGREIANPRAWLYQVVRNYMLERLKGAAARRETAVEQAESVAARQLDPQTIVETSETAREIAAVSRRAAAPFRRSSM